MTEFEIKKVDPKSVEWRGQYDGPPTKNIQIYERVKKMKIGGAISIKPGSHSLGSNIRTFCSRHSPGDYRIRTRLVKDTLYVMKVRKPKEETHGED